MFVENYIFFYLRRLFANCDETALPFVCLHFKPIFFCFVFHLRGAHAMYLKEQKGEKKKKRVCVWVQNRWNSWQNELYNRFIFSAVSHGKNRRGCGCFFSFRASVRAAHLVSLISIRRLFSFIAGHIFFGRCGESWSLLFQSNFCLIFSLIPRSCVGYCCCRYNSFLSFSICLSFTHKLTTCPI